MPKEGLLLGPTAVATCRGERHYGGPVSTPCPGRPSRVRHAPRVEGYASVTRPAGLVCSPHPDQRRLGSKWTPMFSPSERQL